MDLIVRGHQVAKGGYDLFAGRQLVTLWGAPNYREEFPNDSAIMTIDETLLVSFQVCLQIFMPSLAGSSQSLMMIGLSDSQTGVERKQKFGQR